MEKETRLVPWARVLLAPQVHRWGTYTHRSRRVREQAHGPVYTRVLVQDEDAQSRGMRRGDVFASTKKLALYGFSSRLPLRWNQ
jgi:hypothetical protein